MQVRPDVLAELCGESRTGIIQHSADQEWGLLTELGRAWTPGAGTVGSAPESE